MFKKMFRINESNQVNIWVKKSVVKMGKQKTLLIEVHATSTQYFKFISNKHLKVLKMNPLYIFELIDVDENIKHLLQENQCFYYNGKKESIDKRYLERVL